MAADQQVLRGCDARECNSATDDQKHATKPATSAQQTSLKALAMQALGRNEARNEPATGGRTGVQQHAGSASPVVARQVTCETCSRFTPDPINPPAGAGACGIGKGEESIGPSLHPMAPCACKHHFKAITDESRLKEIARMQGMDWTAARAGMSDKDIEASRPYLDSDDPREYEGIVTWLRVLADPSIVKIPPSTRDSPCS